MKVKVIECVVKDDGDYDWLYDNAIQNTLKEKFDWADSCKGSLHFEKALVDNNHYMLTLHVDAIFDNKEDLALYRLTFGDDPLTKLVTEHNMESYFV